MNANKPVLLRSDNFTPPTRTPWGGTRIVERYKAALQVARAGTVVGESWEVSVEPDFPSRLHGSDEPLGQLIAEDPVAWLGRDVAHRFDGQTPLLVKLLDSADNLSVQVHPVDGDEALASDESGKPESWIILEAAAGAGLYLGFGDGVDREAVQRCIAEQGPLQQLLHFVPVRAGDVFTISAGTPHSIGRGVTLVEPQFVSPGRRGITYRFWDWNRRYDSSGRLDPAGEARPLHLERSLAATDWDAPRGEAFVASCRPTAAVLDGGEVVRHQLLSWPWFIVERWSGTGTLHVPAPGTLWALTCVGGHGTVRAGQGQARLASGQSCVVPAAAGAVDLEGHDIAVFATRSAVATDGMP